VAWLDEVLAESIAAMAATKIIVRTKASSFCRVD
jgi:hypothetical protein